MKAKTLLPYFCIAIITPGVFYSTRGTDGDLKLAVITLAVLLLAYTVSLVITIKKRIWLHGLGHLLAFEAVAVMAMLYDTRLDGMAGMLYGLLPAALFLVVVLGWLLALALQRLRNTPVNQ